MKRKSEAFAIFRQWKRDVEAFSKKRSASSTYHQIGSNSSKATAAMNL
jgi:hypothetical protein